MMQRTQAAFFVTALGLATIAGCKSAPAPAPTSAAVSKPAAVTYPPRPTVPPPAFKLFHLEGSSITLVTKEDASDEQIEAILLDDYQISQVEIDGLWTYVGCKEAEKTG